MTIQSSEWIYWYVVFKGNDGIFGNWVLKQYGPSPDGFNLADGHRELRRVMNTMIIITYWVQITKKRFEEMEVLNAEHSKKAPEKESQGPLIINTGKIATD